MIVDEPFANLRQAEASPELRARRIEAKDEAASRKRRARARRRNITILKLCGGWVLFLVALVLFGQWFWKGEKHMAERAEEEVVATGVFGEADTVLLTEAMPLISRNFSEFIAAGDPVKRSSFIRKPLDAAVKMDRFYQLNSLPSLEAGNLSLASNDVLRIGDEIAVANTWNSKDGLKIETVFFKEGDEWRLDWEHFARYSDFLWPLFLAGHGPDEGEFRLLARRRLVSEKMPSPLLSVVFYSPRFGKPSEAGTASPEFLIERGSEVGRLLAATFRAGEKGIHPFTGKHGEQDPEGMVRVRVKVKRINDAKGRLFEVTKVIACHWLTIEDPDLAPLTEAEAAAREDLQAPKRAD